MFVGLGVSGVVPVIHGSMIYGLQGLEERMSLSWVVLHGVMYILGAFLYAVSVLTTSMTGFLVGVRAEADFEQ